LAKRFIVQKRELKERHGKKPHLMGPYRTVYSDIRPPFDLSDKERIEASLLRNYGEGRYQVKSVGKEEGEKKSRITVHFSGDVERYRSRAKTWTKQERVESVHWRKRKPREKALVVIAFLIAFLAAFWLFLAAVGSALDSSVVALAVIVLVSLFAGAIFFIDMMLFETE
jgi:hypothetical protein